MNTLTKQTLNDGSIRLRAGNCGFLFSRIAPSVIYTAVAGADSGQLGAAPLDEITAEFHRFGRRITWFIDAENSPGVLSGVREQWTAWLQNHNHYFDKICVMSNNRSLFLTIEVAKHFSKMHSLVSYDDRRLFDQAVYKATGKMHQVRANWMTEEPIAIEESNRNGEKIFETARVSFTFKRLSQNSVFSTISGIDDGALSNIPFDFMSTLIEAGSKKFTWYVDCSNVTRISDRTMEDWMHWVLAHEKQLDSVHMYVPSAGVIPLLIGLAKSRTNSHKLIHLHQSLESFHRVLGGNPMNTVSA